MGLFSSLRAGAKEERRASITVYTEELEASLKDDSLAGSERIVKEREKESFERMSDKEKMKWIEFKKNKGMNPKEGAAGLYAGGKCC